MQGELWWGDISRRALIRSRVNSHEEIGCHLTVEAARKIGVQGGDEIPEKIASIDGRGGEEGGNGRQQRQFGP